MLSYNDAIISSGEKMPELWNVRAEIMVHPEDFASGDTLGFMNIITWADSAETAREKIEHYFNRSTGILSVWKRGKF
jgi:hypothetical protein